jgi:predicted nucleic acid-binding protein
VVIFLDSSALLKLHLPELGAGWLRNFVVNQQICISELALFETANVIKRLYVENNLTKDEATDLIAKINRDSTGYEIIALGGSLQLNRLISLLFSLPIPLRIRTLDSLHLTAAEIALEDARSLNPPQTLVFISSDQRLLQIAQARGFATENPEDYP